MPHLDTLFFYIFAAMALAGAIATITFRSAVHCAISLIGSLLGVAGLYLLLQAEFLFAVQIILYIGGIMLLFLFVIMLVNLDEAAQQHRYSGQLWIAVACLTGIAFEIAWFAGQGSESLPWTHTSESVAPSTGNTEAIADVLFSQYLLPFEIASIMLLVAVVGSVFMARKSGT
ncbi:MAG: NADH-quinone oxidoreductase subunit J [Bryobacteraceae bacterium]